MRVFLGFVGNTPILLFMVAKGVRQSFKVNSDQLMRLALTVHPL